MNGPASSGLTRPLLVSMTIKVISVAKPHRMSSTSPTTRSIVGGFMGIRLSGERARNVVAEATFQMNGERAAQKRSIGTARRDCEHQRYQAGNRLPFSSHAPQGVLGFSKVAPGAQATVL